MLSTLLFKAGCKKDKTWAQFLFQILMISLVFHIIAAVQSSGFYQVSEHVQNLELVNYQLGRTSAAELPLAFHHRLIPWMLPGIFTMMAQSLNWIGIHNPFQWALGFRLFAALLGWLATAGLSLCCYGWFEEKKWKKRAVLALNFVWYLPSFHARSSSENIGGAFFFLALSLLFLASPLICDQSLHSKKTSSPQSWSSFTTVFAGLLMGIALECSPQLAPLVVGLILWILFFGKIKISKREKRIPKLLTSILLPLSLSLSIPLILGIGFDRWGYHEWSWTLFNCLQLQWMHFQFSQLHLAIWSLLGWSWTHGTPILGPLVVLSFFCFWCTHPKHPLTWCGLPFFVITTASTPLMDPIGAYPHFPLLHMGGLAFAFCLKDFSNWAKHWASIHPIDSTQSSGKLAKAFQSTCWTGGWAGVALNGISFALLSTLPAWMPIRFYTRLYTFKPYKFLVNYQDQSLFKLDENPMQFYLPRDVSFHQIQNESELVHTLVDQESAQWLFVPSYSLPEESSQLKKWCNLEFSTVPQWLGTQMEKLGPRFSPYGFKNWALYRCQSPNRLQTTLQDADSDTSSDSSQEISD
jgi:hypothetical protein